MKRVRRLPPSPRERQPRRTIQTTAVDGLPRAARRRVGQTAARRYRLVATLSAGCMEGMALAARSFAAPQRRPLPWLHNISVGAAVVAVIIPMARAAATGPLNRAIAHLATARPR